MMRSIKLFFGIVSILFASLVFAQPGSQIQIQNKSLSLYADPQTNAKVIATLATGQTIITIYEQKDWVKVANPQNGDVGWARKADIAQNKVVFQAPFVREYQINEKGKNGNNSQSYRIITYSNNKPLEPQQAQKLFDQIQDQQRQMQENLARMMQQTYRSFGVTDVFQPFTPFTIDTQTTYPNAQTVIIIPAAPKK